MRAIQENELLNMETLPNFSSESPTFPNPTILCSNREIRSQQTFYKRKEHKWWAYHHLCKKGIYIKALVVPQ